MNSLSQKCQEAKEKYDACFNKWFSERYLKGDTRDECEPVFKVYQACVKEAIEEHKIELWNLPSEYEPSSAKKGGTGAKNFSDEHHFKHSNEPKK
jgi:TRIAP1/MDM35 family protein